MRWAGEQGPSRQRKLSSAVASICSPLDLAASGHAIGQGFNKVVYTRMFLRSMKPKAMAKWQQHPGLFDPKRLLAAHDLYEFDNIFTAPLHGFKDTEDYWTQASAKPHLSRIAVPALLLNAQNDPFIPAHSLPTPNDISPHVQLWQPRHGGHVRIYNGQAPWASAQPAPSRRQLAPEAHTPWMTSFSKPCANGPTFPTVTAGSGLMSVASGSCETTQRKPKAASTAVCPAPKAHC